MSTLLKNSSINTPTQAFIDEFNEVFDISLLDGKWHDKMFSLQQGSFIFQVMKFDRLLDERDPEYDFDNATYQGKPTSMNDYVWQKFGKRAVAMLDYLTQNNDGFATEFKYTEN
jgi:hypothetical protein